MLKEWNVSKLAMLRQCHRKFFFGYEIARHEFTHPYRRKAFELSKSKTLKMWQGSLIDYAVTFMILPFYRSKETPDFECIANEVIAMAKRQYNYSKNGYYHRQDISRSDVGDDFLILDIHESNIDYKSSDINEIYEKVRKIILAFPTYPSPEINKTMAVYLSDSGFLRADVKKFRYTYGDIVINPQIDLIRYKHTSLDIIDWKVSERDDADYSRQLILNGIVSLHQRRNTFKNNGWVPLPQLDNARLFEINLLNGQVTQYPLTKESTARALDYTSSFADEQEQLSQNKPWDQLDIESYERTNTVETCISCKFRPLCKHLLMNNLKYDENEYYKLVQNKELV